MIITSILMRQSENNNFFLTYYYEGPNISVSDPEVVIDTYKQINKHIQRKGKVKTKHKR